MKGKTTIELINIKNNKKEILEEENLVTDVLEKILTLNPSALTNETSKDIYYPIVEKLMGGILLFKDRIEEEKNTTFITTTNTCIGYAGQNAEIQTDTINGSFNKEESQKTTSGYKYVWDFGTSKANGKISSVCLTNAKAGGGYFGTKSDGKTNRIKLGEYKYLIKDTDTEMKKKYVNAVEANFEENYIVSIVPESDHLRIIKSREPLLNFRLNDSLSFLAEKNITETKIKYKKSYGTYGVCIYVDEENYYLLKTSTSGGNTNVTKLKINKVNNSIEETEFTLENVKIENIGAYSLDYDYYRTIKSVLRGGYVYAVSTDEKYVVKFAINNPVDLTKIDVPFQIRVDYVTNKNTGCSMYLLGDMICGTNFTIDKNDKVKQIAANDLSKIASTPITYGPFLMGFFANGENYGDKYLRKILYLITPYAATINNLSKTLEKTAEKTMKITYYLTGGK
ncbi:hypothetical protein KMP11_02180 [Gemella sp. zg-570]|uniref:hypothetical protein n=1 Tax=Gemella sp. zg-570 TaxID=2840371 RepID=UPI001C0DFE6D|nr:hypothetical protein [Gemella sp. zg-570]QWQ39160.1 hypothetical protein KMP11_02180 [Gemella sp. zg-570]